MVMSSLMSYCIKNKSTVFVKHPDALVKANQLVQMVQQDNSLINNASSRYTLKLAKDVKYLHELFKHELLKHAITIDVEDGVLVTLQMLDKMYLPNYLPDMQEILQSRRKTIGIVKYSFPFKQSTLNAYDGKLLIDHNLVGGARNERIKWFHCLENVSAVIFTVGSTNFAKISLYDDVTDRMTEDMELFKEILNNPTLKNSLIFLVFTKVDVFFENYATWRHELKKMFPHFQSKHSII